VRIAQVSPLFESVPPRQYGGTERVVSYLTEELVRQGHDVTLFATGDSVTTARLVACSPRSLRGWTDCVDPQVHHVLMLEMVERLAHEFDVIHFHIDYLHFPIGRRADWPALTTLHGRLDIPDLQPMYDEFQDAAVVSISESQRAPLPQANWLGTVHHGLPRDLFSFHAAPDDYLAFVGRASPEKRVDRAIEIARRAGLRLRIAAKVDQQDREFFETTVRPLLDEPFVDFLGEVGGREKEDLIGQARALLFPIDWAEPFGMVMIEAMACGTPVVAWRAGSVPEVIADGVTGFIVADLDEAVRAVGRVGELSRARCRAAFEERYTADRMAADYLALYARVVRDRRDRPAGTLDGELGLAG
jgi:glycosyltransferase involved in cell wall biosynthesis